MPTKNYQPIDRLCLDNDEIYQTVEWGDDIRGRFTYAHPDRLAMLLDPDPPGLSEAEELALSNADDPSDKTWMPLPLSQPIAAEVEYEHNESSDSEEETYTLKELASYNFVEGSLASRRGGVLPRSTSRSRQARGRGRGYKALRFCGRSDRVLTPEAAAACNQIDDTVLKVQERLDKYEKETVEHQWCTLSNLKTNKPVDKSAKSLTDKIGYVGYSLQGANHAIGGHQVAAFVGTRQAPEKDYEASHLCHNSVCVNPGHLCWESARANNKRKNCTVWQRCTAHENCGKKQATCVHDPPCLKAINGVSWERFREDSGAFLHPRLDD